MGCLESLTVNISPLYAKKQSIYNAQSVRIQSNGCSYPALVIINPKLKVEKNLVNNGCIPSKISGKKFTIEPEFKWLFSESVSLKVIEKLNNEDTTKDISLNCSEHSNITVSDLNNPLSLRLLLKEQLVRNQSLCLKAGMTIKLKYLTQAILFRIEDVKCMFFSLSDDKLSQMGVGFKYFEGTKINIIENEVCNSRNIDEFAFKKFGGYTTIIDDLRENVESFLNGRISISGILISGMSGVGKTYLASIFQSVYREKCKFVVAEDIAGTYKGEAEITMREIFVKAIEKAPSLLYIDDIDELCGSRGRNGKNVGIVNALLHCLDGVQTSQQSRGVLVIATATNTEILDQALRRPGRLSHDIVLTAPTEEERFDILRLLVNQISSSDVDNDFLRLIATQTPGFVASDLLRLITESLSNTEEDQIPSRDEILKALKVVRPSSLKNISPTTKKISLDEFLGYFRLKQEILSLFQIFLNKRDIFAAAGIPCPSRMLLFGPSGCGKSHLVHGLAHHFNLAVIPVKRSSVFGKYFGESEKNLGKLFDQAQKSAPCILHFETFDGIAGMRAKVAEQSSDVEGRVISHLKMLMDGVVGYEGVFIVAETNRPDLLDKDVIRHGRFHRYFYFSLPSTEDRRTAINCYLPKAGVEPDLLRHVLNQLVDITEGFSMAELYALCNEIKSSMHDDSLSLQSAMEEVLSSAMPNTSQRMMRKYKEFSAVYCPKSLRSK